MRIYQARQLISPHLQSEFKRFILINKELFVFFISIVYDYLIDASVNDISTVHINNCCHVHKAFSHAYIDDVGIPNLVGMGNPQVY